MYGAVLLESEAWPDATAIARGLSHHQSNLAFQHPSMPNQHEGTEPMRTNGSFARKSRGQYPANSSRPTTPEITAWFQDKLRGLSTKEVALLAECGERTAENVRLGKCAFNAASQAALFRNSPELRAAYMEYIGILLPGQAETAAAYTRFANAVVRPRA